MLKIPAVPAGAPVWEAFTCTLNGQKAPLHEARVSAMPYNRVWPGKQRSLDQTELCGFVSFETDEPVEVCLTVDRDFDRAIVRPLSRGVTPVWEGRTVRFTLTENDAYVLELDDQHRSLTLFSNPVRDFCVRPEDENVLYFGPGVHEPGTVEVHSGQTVYLDPEAVVYGTLVGYGVHDVRILGYGVLDGSRVVRDKECCYPHRERGIFPKDNAEIRQYLKDGNAFHGTVQIWRGQNIEIEGPVLRDSATFAGQLANVNGMRIRNVKTIGMWRYNSDGLDLFNCQNVVIEHCFLRNFDDCIVIKGIGGYHDQPNENIVVRRCTVWCDWGGALEIGAETRAPYYRNILFEDCDVIRAGCVCMRIHHHNEADISHVVYRDIRCEYPAAYHGQVYHSVEEEPYPDPQPPEYPWLIDLPIVRSGLFVYGEPYENGNTHDILFENIRVMVEPQGLRPVIRMEGQDEAHTVRNVRIEGLWFNEERITDPAEFRIIGPVQNVTLR